MRLPGLGNRDCGCNERKFIMFQAGQLGLGEAMILVGSILILLAVTGFVTEGK